MARPQGRDNPVHPARSWVSPCAIALPLALHSSDKEPSMFHQWYSASLERQKEIEAMVKRQRVPAEWEDETPGLFRRVLLVVQECVARRAARPKQPHASH